MNTAEIIQKSIDVKIALLNDETLVKKIEKLSQTIIDAYRNNPDSKVLICGNGGSAADAQHWAAELTGRFYYDRPPLQADALHTDTSFLTAVANDYSYYEVFARMVKAKGRAGDVLIGLSTSGNSANVINAMKCAKSQNMFVVALTGESGGEMKKHCDILLNMPSTDTPRIQECHALIAHIVSEQVEANLFPKQ
ncbi:phosphoheptose isomerase [Bacteroidia bacterium]|nr:phosphoheptose isomerase [Bacteroidia bacterium]